MIIASSRLALVVATCSAVIFLSATREAAAQAVSVPADTATPRLAVFAAGGYNGQWDDESSLGRGAAIGGGVGFRLTKRLWIEGVVTRFGHQRDLSYYAITYDAAGNPVATPYPSTLEGSATCVLAQARYVFSTSKVQPYAAGAAGVMHYAGNGWAAVFPPEPGQPRSATAGVSATTLATGGTAGVDVRVGRSVKVGPYVGLLFSNAVETGTKYLMHGGVRAGFEW